MSEGAYRVLVVDDDPDVAQYTRTLLDAVPVPAEADDCIACQG